MKAGMPEAAVIRGNILGFDFGHRRIGVAVGQFATRTASAVETLAHREGPDWPALDRLVRAWRPAAFVVGLPLDLEGHETELSRAARGFGATLQERYGAPCSFFDERLTSRAAAARFAELRAAGSLRRKHAGRTDAMAAQIILENWLQSHAGNPRAPGSERA
jgi:putative Holliday junction resolvase